MLLFVICKRRIIGDIILFFPSVFLAFCFAQTALDATCLYYYYYFFNIISKTFQTEKKCIPRSESMGISLFFSIHIFFYYFSCCLFNWHLWNIHIPTQCMQWIYLDQNPFQHSAAKHWTNWIFHRAKKTERNEVQKKERKRTRELHKHVVYIFLNQNLIQIYITHLKWFVHQSVKSSIIFIYI